MHYTIRRHAVLGIETAFGLQVFHVLTTVSLKLYDVLNIHVIVAFIFIIAGTK